MENLKWIKRKNVFSLIKLNRNFYWMKKNYIDCEVELKNLGKRFTGSELDQISSSFEEINISEMEKEILEIKNNMSKEDGCLQIELQSKIHLLNWQIDKINMVFISIEHLSLRLF